MNDHRPPYGAAALAGLAAFAIYALTLAPTTAFWDTSEYIATGYILGIPHPPGNPLFVVLARVWILLLEPTGLSVAVRVNLLAAVTTSAAVFFLFLVAHRILRVVVGEERGRVALVGASASALVAATTYTVWNQANVNEKVYTISVLVIAAVTWLAVRWYDTPDGARRDRYLLVALFLMVLGSTNHLMSVLPAPALGVLVLLADPRFLLRRTFLVRAVPLVLLGLSFNFFLPIRAAQDPVINEGDPTCESAAGAAVAIYTNGKKGCGALAYNLTRGQYQKPSVGERQAPFGAQLENYWQYFGWQWARGLDPSALPGSARLPVNLLFLGLGFTGLWAAFRVDRMLFAYLGVLVGTLTVGLVFYLNFEYGFSLAEQGQPSEVRERDYFFIASFIFWGMLAGVGLTWLWAALARQLQSTRAWAFSAPVLGIAVLPLVFNWGWADRSDDWAARDWAYDLLMSVEPYAVLFTNGDNDTFPLWYAQEVEGIRKDVTVIVGQYLHTDWYPKQLNQLTRPENQRPFDPAQSAGIYEAPAAPPTEPLTRLTDEQLDRIGGARLGQDETIGLGTLAVTYPAGMVLNREHQIVLSVIADSIDERPIYFAAAGGTMAQIGLDRWGVREGLVTRLLPRNLETAVVEGVAQGSPEYGGVYYDVPRSLTLWNDVYAFRSIRERDVWQDRSTTMIPFMFYATALQLADITRNEGYAPEVFRALEDDAIAFQRVTEAGTPAALP